MKLSNTSAVLTTIATICAVSTAFQSVTPSAGYAYLQVPASRNYYASDTSEGGGGSDWDNPEDAAKGIQKARREGIPYGLDQNKGVCGVTQPSDDGTPTRDYDQWLDWKGTPMPWKSQETYQVGDTITVELWMERNFQGHFQLRGCPVEDGKSSSATEECFEQYPLTFVEDVTHGVPKDEAYPERAYIYGGNQSDKVNMEYKFKLPDGLSGDKVLLQFFWYTGFCRYPGYDEYLTEENKEKLKWDKSDYPNCPDGEYPYDGKPFTMDPNTGLHEYFVNCAEVTIGGTAPPMLRSF